MSQISQGVHSNCAALCFRIVSPSRKICHQVRIAFLLIALGTCQAQADLDDQLASQLQAAGISALPKPSGLDPNQVELGRSLFFDRELSGHRDTACASCHHPSTMSGDSRSLPSGVGGIGLGPDRTLADGHEMIPRNSPEVFDRGNAEWRTMFWDSRVTQNAEGLQTPAGPNLPAGLDSPLAAQAMFPVTSQAEMRGFDGLDVFGNPNELAQFSDAETPAIWNALMNRILAIPQYQDLFQKAYPDTPQDMLGFEDAANAIAAFESQAFSTADSRWDQYLAGDKDAISDSAKRGGHLFHGGANCASCHSGNIMTDQEHHNLAVPQLGPGKDASGLDIGRMLETGDAEDEFAFRTPPLRNTAATGPWMHNGSYTTLEGAVRHHLDATSALQNYDVLQLDESIRSTVRLDAETISRLTTSVDASLPDGVSLTDQDVDDLVAFLFSLTSPTIDRLATSTPLTVPSGLPVDQPPPSMVTIAYNTETGGLELSGPDDVVIDCFFLRIDGDDESIPVELRFETGKSPWAGELDLVLSDDETAQSFMDYRAASEFLLSSGDQIEGLLPAGLSSEMIESFLSAAYRLVGSPMIQSANVTVVPEPSPVVLTTIGLFVFALTRRR